MRRAWVLDFWDSWDRLVKLIDFSYNNNYHSGIGIAPFEALCGRKWRSPLYWDEIGEKLITDPIWWKESWRKLRLFEKD